MTRALAVDFDLLAIRHGRTEWNSGGRFQGRTDVPLDETGRSQARALGASLATERISWAVSSGLSRACETARIVLAGRRVDVSVDEDWSEMAFGEWEGLTWPEITARYPSATGRSDGFPTPVGGESFGAVTTRVASALERVRRRAEPGDVVLVATHAGALHGLLRAALGHDEARALAVRFEPAQAIRIRYRGGVASLDRPESPHPARVAG